MDYKVGQTISASDFKKSYPVGKTISADEFNSTYGGNNQQSSIFQSNQPTATVDNPQLGGNTSQQNAFKTAQFLGVSKAGQGLATAGRVASGSINNSANFSAQSDKQNAQLLQQLHQMVLDHVPATDPKRTQLTNMIKQIYGSQGGGFGATTLNNTQGSLGNTQGTTEAEIDPGTQLSNKEVLGSFGNLGLLATSPADMLSGGKTLAGKVAAGAALGYASDVANAANNNKSNVFKPGLGTAVGVGLPVVTQVGGEILKRLTGITTGAGKNVIQRAIDNPEEVNAAINKYAKTPEAKQQLVDKVDEALSTLVKQRNDEYQTGLNNLVVNNPNSLKANEISDHINVLNDAYVKSPTPANKKALDQAVQTYKDLLSGNGINKDTVTNSFVKNLKGFGGRIDENGNLAFQNSKLTTTDKNSLSQAWDDIKQWTDVTPQGFDALRQNIKNYMDDFKIAGNSRANVILGNVKTDLTKEMTSKIPGYSELLSNYGDKTEAINSLKAELTTRSNSPTTQLNKVMKIFKKDPSVINTLTEELGQKETNKLLNDVSGAILSTWMPQTGAIGKLARGGAEAGILLHGGVAGLANPGTLAAGTGMALASSPRFVGKVATKSGQLGQLGLSSAFRKAATILGSKANR